MRVIIPIDMKWDKLRFLKAIKGAKNIKLVTILDEELLSLSIEISAEKGWLGEDTITRLKRVLKEQMEKMKREYEKKASEILEQRDILFTIEHMVGNFKEKLLEISKHSPEKIVFVYKKGYNPYWQVLKPVIQDLCKILNCEIVK